MEERYLIPTELKSETYFGKGFFLFDVAFIIGFWFFMSNLEFLLHEGVKIFYTVFNICVAVFLTRKSHRNPGKRLYQSLIFGILAKKNQSYHTKESNVKKEVHFFG